MWQSLLIKIGMFAVTLGVVFWIGWSLPTSLDRERGLATGSLEGSQTEIPADSGRDISLGVSSVSLLPDQPATVAPSNRAHKALLDLNKATERDFDALPGIGPQLAERILKYRKSVGAFHSPEELRAVKGIGKKKFERIRPLITVMPDTGLSDGQKKAT